MPSLFIKVKNMTLIYYSKTNSVNFSLKITKYYILYVAANTSFSYKFSWELFRFRSIWWTFWWWMWRNKGKYGWLSLQN